MSLELYHTAEEEFKVNWPVLNPTSCSFARHLVGNMAMVCSFAHHDSHQPAKIIDPNMCKFIASLITPDLKEILNHKNIGIWNNRNISGKLIYHYVQIFCEYRD